MYGYLATACCLIVLGTTAVFSQEAPLKSGPQPGEFLPGPFHFLNVNGTYAGSPHCLVCEFGLKPVVAVFAREAPMDDDKGKTLLTLLSKLDEAIGQREKAEMCGFATFLSKDFSEETPRKALVKRLEDVANNKVKRFVVSVGGPEGPEKYNLNANGEVTVLLYVKHKVVANFAFAKDKLSDKDIDPILTAVAKMVPKK